jgi:hypothetical protein
MGFAPPTSGPTPSPPGTVSANAGPAGFSVGSGPAPSAASLCGFQFPPTLFFKFGFTLPPLPQLPIPHLSLGLNCNLSNPLSVNAGLTYGGGRTSNAPPDPDMQENT